MAKGACLRPGGRGVHPPSEQVVDQFVDRLASMLAFPEDWTDLVMSEPEPVASMRTKPSSANPKP